MIRSDWRSLRLRAELSLRDVEVMAGVNRGTLSAIERGRIVPAPEECLALLEVYRPEHPLVTETRKQRQQLAAAVASAPARIGYALFVDESPEAVLEAVDDGEQLAARARARGAAVRLLNVELIGPGAARVDELGAALDELPVRSDVGPGEGTKYPRDIEPATAWSEGHTTPIEAPGQVGLDEVLGS